MPYGDDIALNFCGHMFCVPCYKGWFAEGDQPFRCPCCRFDLHFPAPDCRHVMRASAVPGFYADHYGGAQRIRHVPRTLVEGGEVQQRCNKCTIQRHMSVVEAAAERMGIERPAWADLLGAGGEREMPGLAAEELSALGELRRMRNGYQGPWDVVREVAGLDREGVV
jgi:hypothetical protein